MNLEKEQILRDLYYSSKTGYKNIDNFYNLIKEEYPSVNISKYFIKQWLLKQSVYTKFKQFNHPKHYRHTFVRDFDQLQMDLVFLSSHKEENEGYHIILSSIEILSRYAFCVPMKTKSGKETKEAVKLVVESFEERFNKKVEKIQFDEGSEFLNKNVIGYLSSLDIVYFSTASPRKASVVERFNRTMKEKMAKMFESRKNHEWIDDLQDLVENYNNTIHSSIGMKPSEVNNNNKYIVWRRLFGHIMTIKKPKFHIDDNVRVLHFDLQYRKTQMKDFREKYRKRDEKGKYKAPSHAIVTKGKSPFSDEIFKIEEIKLGDPNVYKVSYNEKEIPGIFYEEELSLVKTDE